MAREAQHDTAEALLRRPEVDAVSVPTEADWTDGGRRPPISHVDDYQRAVLAEIDGRWVPSLDDEQVTVSVYEAFRKEWAAFYDAIETEEER